MIVKIKGVRADVGDIVRLTLKGRILPNYTGVMICADEDSIEFVDANALALDERQHIKTKAIKKVKIVQHAEKAIPKQSGKKKFQQGQTVTSNIDSDEDEDRTGRVVAALNKIVFVEITPRNLIFGKAKHFN